MNFFVVPVLTEPEAMDNNSIISGGNVRNRKYSMGTFQAKMSFF